MTFAKSLPWLSGLLKFPASNGSIPVRGSPASTINMDDVMSIFEENFPNNAKQVNIFLSLLYFYGALTTKSITEEAEYYTCELGAPNNVAQMEYLKEIDDIINPDVLSLNIAKEAFNRFITENNPMPVMDSFLTDNFQITKWNRGGSDVYDPEASFKVQLLMCFNLVKGNTATIHNEFRFDPEKKGDVLSSFGTYSDLQIIPNDENLSGIILELKNVTVASLSPGKEDFNQKIEMVKNKLKDKGATEILKMEFTINKDGQEVTQTIAQLKEDALKQVGDYLKKANEQKPRKSGYKGWVVIRVGLTKILSFEFKPNQ